MGPGFQETHLPSIHVWLSSSRKPVLPRILQISGYYTTYQGGLV